MKLCVMNIHGTVRSKLFRTHSSHWINCSNTLAVSFLYEVCSAPARVLLN